LIVSDAASLGEPIRQAFLRLQKPSVLAETSAEAIHRIGEDAPIAVIVDLAFTEMDPLQIAHRVRTCPETIGAPVIGLAPDSPVQDQDVLLSGGFTFVLPRSTDPREIVVAVLEQTQKR
jgi:CheY-like chemotaxis protein